MRPTVSSAVAALAGIVYLTAHAAPASVPDTATALEKFLSAADAPLTSYTATRTLEASARGGSMRATLSAATSLDPVAGFTYTVIDAQGSGVIRKHVLHAALEAERQIVATQQSALGALTPTNYAFEPAPTSDADTLVSYAIHAKRRDTMLLEGTIFLTEADGDLVRVEGVLVKRPSFWTRRVAVTRHYARISGVRVPVRMESSARVLMAGTSSFTMTYAYRSINGQPVEALPD